MKRSVLCTSIIVSILAGCSAAAPSTAPSQAAASPAPSVSASAEASTAPSASPSTSAAYPAWYTGDRDAAGILPTGRQTTRSFMPGSTFAVPEGWVNDVDLSIVYELFPDTPANEAEYSLSGETAQGISMVSVDSPYFLCEAWEASRGTAAERVASLVASDALAVSEPIDVTIGGLIGKQVDVRLDPGWKEDCPDGTPTSDLGDARNRVTYLDTPDHGVIAIAVGSRHSAGHEAFLVEAMPIVESLQFETGP